MTRLRDLLLQAASSLWFVPAWITLVMGLMAIGAIWLDVTVDERLGDGALAESYPYLFGAGREGATAMLSTMAGALVTAAGVSLSGVLVAFSIASSQYTSRILRMLTGDHVSQVTLGLILGSFVYSLVVLKSVGTGGSGEFVPELAVLFAVPVGLVGICSLVFFVHSVSRSIQAGEILERIALETHDSIQTAFPRGVADSASRPGTVDGMQSDGDTVYSSYLEGEPLDWIPIPAKTSGYLRAVDAEALMDLAVEQDALLQLDNLIGSYIHAGQSLASFLYVTLPAGESAGESDQDSAGSDSEHSGTEFPEEDEIAEIQNAFRVGSFRTVEQDAAFGLRQMVDIALKALSPGVNDTTTAVMAVHRITSALRVVAERETPMSRRFRDGILRLIVRRHNLGTLLSLGYEEILRSADTQPACLLALVEGWKALADVATTTPRGQQGREALADFLSEVAPVVRKATAELPQWGLASTVDEVLSGAMYAVGLDTKKPRAERD